MNSMHRTARLALVALSGVTLAAGLILTGLACQSTGSGDEFRASGRPAEESAYRLVSFNHEQHQLAVDNECTTCHHEAPNAAEAACHSCHSRQEGRFSETFAAFVPRLKEAMHNPDSGCRACHDESTEDGLWDCGQCHVRGQTGGDD
jgi:hypothetical protein